MARRQERGGESISQELRDDRGLVDYFFLVDTWDGVFDRRHEAAGVDVEIPLGTGGVEVDDGFFEGEAEFFEDDVRAVGEGAAVVGVELDLGMLVYRCCSDPKCDGRGTFGGVAPPLVPLTCTLVDVPLAVAIVKCWLVTDGRFWYLMSVLLLFRCEVFFDNSRGA